MSSNLWTAASDGDLGRVRQLFDAGCHSTNDADDQGYTCLHAASSYAHLELLRYLLSRPDVDVNARDADGDTALHACEDVASAQLLLDNGADSTALNAHGLSPADVTRQEGHVHVADFFDNLHSAESDVRDPKRRR